MLTPKQRYWVNTFQVSVIGFVVLMIVFPYDTTKDAVPWWVGGPIIMAIFATVLTWLQFRDK